MINGVHHDPESVRALFDEMAQTYGVVNLVSSFGFAVRWRHQAIAALPATTPLCRIADLMSGMGELWRSINKLVVGTSEVVAVDLSWEMMRRAPRAAPFKIERHTSDVLTCGLDSGSFDAVVSSFGLKTFSPAQQEQLAGVVARLLRPGGVFSFVEISVPANRSLRWLYMFYVKRVIPFLGRLFLGNPANYRLLGRYTEAFGDCRHFARCLRQAGLQADFTQYFFGCATGVQGRRRA